MSGTSETMSSPQATGGKKMRSPALRNRGFESTVSKALAREKFNRHVELLTGEFADVLTLHEAVNAIPSRMNSVIINVPGVGEVPFTKKDFNNLVANFEQELLDLSYLQTTVRKVRTREEGEARNKNGYYTFVGDDQYPTALSEFIKDPNGGKFGTIGDVPLVSNLPLLMSRGVAYSSTINNLFYILSTIDDINGSSSFVNNRYQYFVGNGTNTVLPPLITANGLWRTLDPQNAANTTFEVVSQKAYLSRAKKDVEQQGRTSLASPSRAKLLKNKNSKATRKTSPKRKDNTPDLNKKDPFKSVSYIAINSLTLSKIEKFRNYSKKNQITNQVNGDNAQPTLTGEDIALFDRVEALLVPEAADNSGRRLSDIAAAEAKYVSDYYQQLKQVKENQSAQ